MNVATSIRLPKNIYDEVKKDAEEQQRSVAGQISFILSIYYKNKAKLLNKDGNSNSENN